MLFSYLHDILIFVWSYDTNLQTHEFSESPYSVQLSFPSHYLMSSTLRFSPEVSGVLFSPLFLMLSILYNKASMVCLSLYICSSNYSALKHMDTGPGGQLNQ